MYRAGFIACLLQDGGQHVAGTAAAVGAGNMNAFEFCMRVVQRYRKSAMVLCRSFYKLPNQSLLNIGSWA